MCIRDRINNSLIYNNTYSNIFSSGSLISASNLVMRNIELYDNSGYNVSLSESGIIKDSKLYNNSGWGSILTAPGESNVEIYRTRFYNNDFSQYNGNPQNFYPSDPFFEIQSLRDNPDTAKEEYLNDTKLANPGLTPNINFSIPKKIDLRSTKPRIAILREQGVNGQNEMAAAFHEVGFDCIDVHMTDLISSRHNLLDFEGLVACGGFSYGDVLGAGGGWANNILFNKSLRDQFGDFFHNEDVFSLGVCNGCQAFSLLSSLIPGADLWPSFEKNISEKFEARLVQISVQESPSIFFKGMVGAVIPVPVAHGEGRVETKATNLYALTKNKLNTISYADHQGKKTENYPANPNGSLNGIAGVTNESGTITVMMPHPERAFLKDQFSWKPEEWSHYSPWIQFFLNARDFVD